MKLLHRLKQLIKTTDTHPQQSSSKPSARFYRLKTRLKDTLSRSLFSQPSSKPVTDTNNQPQSEAKLDSQALPHPVTDTLKAWVTAQGWQYEHKAVDIADTQIHHLILSFVDRSSEWTCVFRINEKTQLVSIYGILADTVPPSHYASMLMAMSLANLNIPFGNLELDPHDGEVRSKVALDAEYTPLTHDALMCHLQGVAGMSELAAKLYADVMSEDAPSPVVLDYLPDTNDLAVHPDDDAPAMHDEVDGEKRKFFLATTQYQ